MIRICIVDDDKLVRKGLITFMPWEKYGMTVVGEANNGESALKFMESHEVDLLITDLSMPVMSGIELMREVRSRYPHMKIVVLTLHQHFEYVQEALRLGAIDYIAKIELESEQFEEILARIAGRLKESEHVHEGADTPDGLEEADSLYVLYALEQRDDLRPDLPPQSGVKEIDTGTWYWTNSSTVPLPDPLPQFFLIHLKEAGERDRKTMIRLLRTYRKFRLFYDYDPTVCLKEISASSIQELAETEQDAPMEELKEKWISGCWMYDQALFDERVEELYAQQLPPIRLARLFYSLSDEWNRLYHHILPEDIEIADFFTSWVEFRAWLVQTRERMKAANEKPMYSEEIQQSIMKAMNLTQQMMDHPISAAEMAHMVNMSSSYFSQCFKDIAGRTYTDYLRDIRLTRAKEYLRNTTQTIQWISEHIGYHDVKYFSRLFREQIGMRPSEYRQQHTER
ncbi:response regulator [Marinicrinis sediminis]|uniref:Response regulator n=1 Tax=Marinicrinis sediminis TaxID=1652465 RepID=A0ABW5R810_9BACL